MTNEQPSADGELRNKLKNEILGQLAFFESGSIYQMSKMLGIRGTTLDAASDTIMYFVDQYIRQEKRALLDRLEAETTELTDSVYRDIFVETIQAERDKL